MKGNGCRLFEFSLVFCSNDKLKGEVRGQFEEISAHGFTFSRTVTLKTSLLFSAILIGRDQRIGVLHEAMKAIVKHLRECELRGFFVKTTEVVDWKKLPILVSY